jgi:hypothetical protein
MRRPSIIWGTRSNTFGHFGSWLSAIEVSYGLAFFENRTGTYFNSEASSAFLQYDYGSRFYSPFFNIYFLQNQLGCIGCCLPSMTRIFAVSHFVRDYNVTSYG